MSIGDIQKENVEGIQAKTLRALSLTNETYIQRVASLQSLPLRLPSLLHARRDGDVPLTRARRRVPASSGDRRLGKCHQNRNHALGDRSHNQSRVSGAPRRHVVAGGQYGTAESGDEHGDDG